MASCGYAALAGGYCGGSIGNPSNTQCVTMGNCAKDIRNGHLKSFGDGFADSTLKTEAELLFARAGKLHVITWYCTNVFIFEKIWSTGNDTHFHGVKNTRKFLCYVILISRFFPTKLVANNFS